MDMEMWPQPRRTEVKKTLAGFWEHTGHNDESPEIEWGEITKKVREIVQAAARAGVISGSILSGTAGAAPLRIRITPNLEHHHHLEKHHYSRQDWSSLAKNIINEAGAEPTLGQAAVIQVTFARLVSGKFGQSLHDIIYAPHQFSWTAHEYAYAAAKDPAGVEKLAALLERDLGAMGPAEVVKMLSAETGLPSGTYYYKRIGTKAKDFDELQWIKNIKHHEFFVDPHEHLAER